MPIERDHEDQEIEMGMKLHPRHISQEQWQTFEGYRADIFTAPAGAGPTTKMLHCAASSFFCRRRQKSSSARMARTVASAMACAGSR